MNPRLPDPQRIDTHASARFCALRQYLVRDEAVFPVEVEGRLYLPMQVYPPDVLFAVSSLPNAEDLLECHSVGFGGTTSPCVDGVMATELLSQVPCQIDPNAVVVSGGVFGIDQAAHMGALDKNGRTVAVLANPPEYGLHPYCPARLFLEDCIRKRGGALMSQYDTFVEDRRERLKERDGVIAGMSEVFVAVECSEDSDTVDTAIRAGLLGNLVLALDWSKIKRIWHHDPRADGTAFLIRKGLAQGFPSSEMAITHPGFEMAFRTILEEWWFHRRRLPGM